MEKNFQRSLDAVLVHEGGYVDHKKDPGGATNMGITHATLSRWRKRRVTKTDVKHLSKNEAAEIYRAKYWLRSDDLPSGVDYCVFDYGVNSGPSRAAKGLQRAIGVKADGVIGPLTLRAVRDKPAKDIINIMCDKRLAWLKRLKHWPTFGKGWARRIAGVRKLSLEMASERKTITTNIPPITAGMGTRLIEVLIGLIRSIIRRG